MSKASASTNARLLAQLGVVEQVRRQGSRRDYYRMASDLFERSMAQRLARWRSFTEVIGEGRRTLPLASVEVRHRLEQYESGFSYMADAIGRAMVQWRGVPSRRLARAGSGEVRTGVAASALLLAGCAGTPSVSGVRGASPSPEVPWTPPAEAVPRVAAADTSARAAVPPDLAERIRRLTLAEIVDLGLRNNPATRLAWANAQAAASVYGSERGAWLPSIDAEVDATRLKTAASQGRTAVEQSVLSPSVTLNYLLFDFGGRSGRVAGARQRLLSASFAAQRRDPGRGAPDPGRLLPAIWPTGRCWRHSAPRSRRPAPT